MASSVLIIGFYGLFCILGGSMGYLRADSLVSLFVGGSAGLICLGLTPAIHAGSRLAALITGAISVWLGVRFAYKFIEVHTLIPSGIMVLLSFLAAIASLRVLVAGKKASAR